MRETLTRWAVFLILYICLAGCSPPPPSKATITNLHYESDGQIYYVAGLLKNDSSNELERVQIHCSFYDAMKNKVGDGEDVIDSLQSARTWRFRIPVAAPGAQRYAIDGASVSGASLDLTIADSP